LPPTFDSASAAATANADGRRFRLPAAFGFFGFGGCLPPPVLRGGDIRTAGCFGFGFEVFIIFRRSSYFKPASAVGVRSTNRF
jgi:hypothetical protein